MATTFTHAIGQHTWTGQSQDHTAVDCVDWHPVVPPRSRVSQQPVASPPVQRVRPARIKAHSITATYKRSMACCQEHWIECWLGGVVAGVTIVLATVLVSLPL